ncbi:hypothetical protein [Streptomyces roseoverticillatus]|uniref:hypothetical protein n=1 Tax=Streptomyces roseoverticillatus TaxID=66429 RepID=UPI001F27A3A4|nr:hypothetical protein [Streptomyces roseoverticillatus]
MTTDLGLLTKAAEKWDKAAKDFESVQKVYDSQVRNISTDGSWTGVASTSAFATSKLTYGQYTAAAKEARAIASLLRDAHGQFTELRGKLQHEVAQAVEAGMKVSDDGTARFDFEKASKALADAARHDPDLHTTESHWTQSIGNLVQAFDDADQGVKLALTDATTSSDIFNDGVNGFNSKAEGDIEKVEGRRQAELARLTHWDDKQLAEMQRLERDNKNSAEFSQTFLAELGPDKTIDYANRLRGLSSGDKKQDYEQLQSGLATNIAAATRDPKTPFYDKWREGLREAGVKNYGSKADPYYGYQSFVSLMEHHDRYGKQFLHDLGNDIIDTEKKHKDIWTQWRRHPGIASDPLDHLMGIMGKDPATATSFLDPGQDGKNDHLKYLLKDRAWPKIALNANGALLSQDDPAARIGLGAALEAAATGEMPGTKHTLGGHTEAEARVMHDTLRTLNEDGKGDKLPANLRAPLGNMLTDYTSDTHEILSRTNEDYKKLGEEGGVWKDGSSVRMAVHKDDLVRIMRGVADDPKAYASMYNAERQYAADTLVRVPFNGNPDNRAAVIEAASSAYGFYDGVSSDVVFDKRDKAIQWARDVSHAVTGSSGAALNFVPAKMGDEETPKGIKVGLDIANRITDFAMYEWTKEQISEASQAAGEQNRAAFNHGQRQVDSLIVEWGAKNDHQTTDGLVRHLVGSGQERHDSARNEAFIALDREK